MDQRRRRDKANSESFLTGGQTETESDVGFAGLNDCPIFWDQLIYSYEPDRSYCYIGPLG
jgi:hypothetical protein